MKLHHIKPLNEEKIPVRPAEELWTENEELVKTYTPTTIYLVKDVEVDGDTQHQVFTEKGDRKVEYGTLSTADLEAGFTPLRSGDRADAEGYVKYRESGDVEAVKYAGETVKVELDASSKEKLEKGDYLIRSSDDEDFTYHVEKAKDFDQEYVEKK